MIRKEINAVAVLVTTVIVLLQSASVTAAVPDKAMFSGEPDRVVYVPVQPRGKNNMDPRKVGDSYNDHFQVLYDHGRKQYYAFWTQASWEGAGDHHICFAKSPDGKK